MRPRELTLPALALVLVLCVGLATVAVATGRSGRDKRPVTKTPSHARTLGVFRHARSARDAGLLPADTGPDYPGVEEYGAEPGQARKVTTGDGPSVIVYPGKTGACIVVDGRALDAGGWSFACKSYGEINRGEWMTTLTASGKTAYVGLLGDRYRSVDANNGHGAKRHDVVNNVYSFVETGGPTADLEAVASDGTRTPQR
jgi:hypothetical protein